jgi:hypothetical protein
LFSVTCTKMLFEKFISCSCFYWQASCSQGESSCLWATRRSASCLDLPWRFVLASNVVSDCVCPVLIIYLLWTLSLYIASTCLSVNQASSIQSLGGTCESITIGHNKSKLPLSWEHGFHCFHYISWFEEAKTMYFC